MRRTIRCAAVVAALLMLAGCSAGGSQSSADSAAHPGAQTGAQSDVRLANPGEASGKSAADSTAADAASNTVEQRQVVTTGALSLTVKDPIKAATTATHLVATAGGRVDDQTEQPATDTRSASATLTLRIPADRLDNTVTALKKLGSVNELSITANDVTTRVKDTDARVTALQTSVDRLLALMSKASDTKDLIAIESALSDRQAELQSLKAQQTYLKDQVAMSTITLSLHAVGTVAAGAPDSFWGGLVAGWNALVAAGDGFLVVLGVLLPWLVLLAIVGGVVWGILRRSRRRKRESAA